MSDDARFMNEAVAAARAGVEAGEGGPFGAVVVKDGAIIGRGCNQVTGGHDPTAHAEVQAIRDACRRLGTFDLAGCEIYATCEPCPMCFAAIHWARLDRVVCGADRGDAAAVGFDDQRLYDILGGEAPPAFAIQRGTGAEACRALMNDWFSRDDRTPY